MPVASTGQPAASHDVQPRLQNLQAFNDSLAERSRQRTLEMRSQLALIESFNQRQEELSAKHMKTLIDLMTIYQRVMDASNAGSSRRHEQEN
jgi:hypothetical protein